jgi:hypothetical protein
MNFNPNGIPLLVQAIQIVFAMDMILIIRYLLVENGLTK